MQPLLKENLDQAAAAAEKPNTENTEYPDAIRVNTERQADVSDSTGSKDRQIIRGVKALTLP